MKQTITVALELAPGQATYELDERGYDALRHFFTDIGYKVSYMSSTLSLDDEPTGQVNASAAVGAEPPHQMKS